MRCCSDEGGAGLCHPVFARILDQTLDEYDRSESTTANLLHKASLPPATASSLCFSRNGYSCRVLPVQDIAWNAMTAHIIMKQVRPNLVEHTSSLLRLLHYH